MTDELGVPRVRATVALVLLAVLGALGLVAPAALLAIFAFVAGGLTSGFATPGWLLLGIGFVLLWTPLVSVLATMAALGIHRRRRWGRRLGRLVGALLLLSVPVSIVGPAAGSEALGDPLGLMSALVGYHLLLALPVDTAVLPGGIDAAAIVRATFGAAISWGLWTGDMEARSTPSAVPGRLNVAAAILTILAIAALIPVAALLGALVFPWSIGGQLDGPVGPRSRSIVTGAALVIVALPAAAAALLSLRAVRAIRRREPAAPIVAPAAATVAAAWATPWLGLVAAIALSESPERGLAPGAQLLLFSLSLGFLVGSIAAVGWAAVSARAWFPPPGAGTLVPRPSRRAVRGVAWVAAGALASVVALPGGGAGPGNCVDDCPAPEPEGAWIGDRKYQWFGFASPDRPLREAGALDDWTPDIPIGDPTVYEIPTVDPDRSVLVRSSESFEQDDRRFEYLLLTTGGDPGAGLTAEACAAVHFEGSNGPGGLCGPPGSIRVSGRGYIGASGYLVPPTRLSPTGETTRVSASWARETGDVPVLGIDGVDPDLAVAIEFNGSAVVYVYEQLEDPSQFPAQLCEFAQELEPTEACPG